jgi:seryl-tRNA synthetase
MLDIRQYRDEPEAVRAALVRRGEDPTVVDDIRRADGAWREGLAELERLRAERNAGSKAISAAAPDDRPIQIDAMRALGDRIGELERLVAGAEAERDNALMRVPNIPADDVPDGESDENNVVLRQRGEPHRPAHARAHWDIGPELGLLDFDRGVRLAGSRFYVLLGDGARLQRALIQWMLDFHVAGGYTEVYPPFVVREACMWNAGQLPKFADNLYRDVEDDLWLVPTAEVPLTNMHAGEILDDDRLPIRYAAYTACFRRERMSSGRDVRGIKRGHQFDKVEMYQFTRPEESDNALQAMLGEAEAMLQALGLTYRVVAVCAGDLGFSAQKTFDLEIWAPGCDEWLEVSSVSNVGSFQARRAGVRFRREPGAVPEPVHTLNGSGLALPRTLAALIETGYRPDGRIDVPEVLRERIGKDILG